MTTARFIAGEKLEVGDAVAIGDDGKLYRAAVQRDLVMDAERQPGEVFEHATVSLRQMNIAAVQFCHRVRPPDQIDDASRLLAKIGERMMPALERIAEIERDMLTYGIAITAPNGERVDPADLLNPPPTDK